MKEKKIRKHLLCEKVPILAILWAMVLTMVMIQIPSIVVAMGVALDVAASSEFTNIVVAVTALIWLLIYKWWFSPDFTGFLKPSASLKNILMLCAPMIVYGLIVDLVSYFDGGMYFNVTLLKLTTCILAGIAEEVAFRAVAFPIGMRYIKSKYRGLITLVFTSILFSLVHASNVLFGADPLTTVFQVVLTFAMGFSIGSIYLGSGNIVPCILIHFLYDIFTISINPDTTDGVLSKQLTTSEIVFMWVQVGLGVALFFASLYLINRKNKKEEINELWDKKWNSAL